MSSSGAQPRQIDVVPHTHWDREWYDPFQTFRLKLVRLIDGLLDLLEGDPSFAEFLLDGQVAIIDDYLAIRPENEQRLRSLAAAGRLTVGPWYILMDEFLVSGETIVRDDAKTLFGAGVAMHAKSPWRACFDPVRVERFSGKKDGQVRAGVTTRA